jgi:hypothetical protein
MRRATLLLASALAASLLVPASASARVQHAFFNSSIPPRIDHLIGFTPTTYAIHPVGQRIVPISVTVSGRRYRFIFDNAAAAVGASATTYLKMLLSDRRFPSPAGVFVDRKLKRKEKRYLKVYVDLGRDADVLVVTRDHPACATGVSRAVAKGIASGAIRTWSGAGVPAPPGGDSIALRRAGIGTDRFVEPRLGAGGRLPAGAKKSYDGGLGEAASGDSRIAAVTSWSRARSFQSSTCAVPVGGSAPTDASVRALTHPNAYPISFVMLKRLKDVRATGAAFVKYLAGPRATDQFHDRGMLPPNGEWPFVPTSQGEPAPF